MGEIEEEDDPKGESAPTPEIVPELALGLKETEVEQDLPAALPDEKPVLSELGRELVLSSKPRVLSKLLVAEVTELLSTDTETGNNIAFTIADDPKEDTKGRFEPAEAGFLASLFCSTRSSC